MGDGASGPDIKEAARERDEFIPIAQARVIEVSKREPVSKAPGTIQPGDTNVRSNQITREDYATAFSNLGAVEPLYDPEMLALLFEHSNSLRQNVDSYATNIDGFGHRFDPFIDLESPDVDRRIAHALQFERERNADEDIEPAEPTDKEIAATKKKITRVMRFEESRLKHFFEFCCPETSFVTLRRRTRQDIEVTGNAYWEVLRNKRGEIAQFVYVPSFTIRLLPVDSYATTLKQRVRVSDLTFEDVDIQRRLRRFVQLVEGNAVYFKEFGDPRIISSKTALEYKTAEDMIMKEPDAAPATELLHFKVHSARSPYGVPRWVGNLLAVIGSRQAEEVNFNYFENKSVPPLAILISGGRMTQASVERVTEYIDSNIKGKRNFHKILVLEADGPGGDANGANAAKMKIDIKPLTGAQHSDALFQNYDERNIDKVGQSFRLPRMLRGDIRDFNKSTADAALTFAEVQVFEPERQEFDFVINRKLMNAMGIRFWKFMSLAPVIRDPVSMSEIIRNLANANVLTPLESRELAGDVFNRQFRRIDADWAKQPGAFTIAGIPVQPDKPSPLVGPGDDDADEDPNFGAAGGELAPARPAPEGIEARYTKQARKQLAKHARRLVELRDALERAGELEWHDRFFGT